MSTETTDFHHSVACSLETSQHLPNPDATASAYSHCRDLTAQHSKSFSLAAHMISADKRPAVWALYAFCRTVDDLVDNPSANVDLALDTWRHITTQRKSIPDDPVAAAWTDTLNRYAIPERYALELIDGVERDLHQTRYDTFTDLSTYCYSVASTVGLMAMHIIGFSGPEAIPYAVKLGIALQMTNVLRDVGEDWESGRLYLPREELAQLGLTERDIAAGIVTDKWRDFMAFQIARTRQLYEEAWPGIRMLDASGQLAIAAAASFYQGILDQIERLDYDVFTNRASVSKWGKLRQLPGIWWRTRIAPAISQ